MSSPEITAVPAADFPARRFGLAIVVAVVLNLVIFALGSAVGATWIANGQAVGWLLVIIATVFAMAIGGGITFLLARRWSKALSVMAWVGLAFAVISGPAPLLATDNAPTGWALGAMHIVTGIVWFVAILPRRAPSAG